MTKLEMMKENKAKYLKCQLWASQQDGLSKFVATEITLRWIKGRNWEGGLGNGKDSQKAFERVMALGYTFEEVEAEFERQTEIF